MRKGVANDPGRRGRIAEVTLELLADRGIRAATHRTIAVAARVPLGLVTYHYATLEDIFVAAFKLLAEQMDARFGDPLRAADTRQAAREVVVEAICGDLRATEQQLKAYRELSAYGSSSPRVHQVALHLHELGIDGLRSHFSESSSRSLDALVEGWWIYQSWSAEPLDEQMVRRAVEALITAFDPPLGGAECRT